MFAARAGDMPENNLRQAEVPVGATIDRPAAGHRARPGLPDRRQGHLRRARRAVRDAGDGGAGPSSPTCGARPASASVIRQPGAADVGRQPSRGWPRCWPTASTELDAVGNPTLAFLASGHRGPQGAHHRQGGRRRGRRGAARREEAELSRAMLGDLVFGVDDETMETGRGRPAAGATGLTLGRRRVADRRADRGAAHATSPALERVLPRRRRLLRQRGEVRPARRARGSGVSARTRRGPWPTACRPAARRRRRAVATGVAGPAEQEGQPPGTVFLGMAVGERRRGRQPAPARRPRAGPPVRHDLGAQPLAAGDLLGRRCRLTPSAAAHAPGSSIQAPTRRITGSLPRHGGSRTGPGGGPQPTGESGCVSRRTLTGPCSVAVVPPPDRHDALRGVMCTCQPCSARWPRHRRSASW